jgi:CubicO group peptidase (beta-lactamase class C family)
MKRSRLFAGLMFGLCLAQARATETPEAVQPPSPVRTQLDRFIAAYNTGDRETMTEYMRANGSVHMQQEAPILQALDWYNDMGRFEPIEVTESGALALTSVVRTLDSDQMLGVTLQVEPEPPHRIVTLWLVVGDVPERYRPPRMTDVAAADAWLAATGRLAAGGKFSGAIYFARGGKVMARAAFGFADRDRRISNTIETRFRTASVTKMFTAVAVLRLVQDRKISLDDPLGKWVSELAGEPLGLGTVHQYLTHTAGAGDLFDARYLGHQRELRTHDDYLRVFGKDLLKMPPGQEFSYSSLGYMLLGSLIERVTGKSYGEAVRKAVFAPARMTRTGTEPEDVPVEGRAIGYDRPPGSRDLVSAMDHIDYRPFAASGAYTTVEDLARFFAALRSHKLLNAKYTGLMLTPIAQGEGATLYGYGMKIRGRSAEHWIGHDGVDHGMNAEAWFSPETDRVIVILANLDVPAAAQALDFLEPRLAR